MIDEMFDSNDRREWSRRRRWRTDITRALCVNGTIVMAYDPALPQGHGDG
jgi:hypothetical protein